VLYILISGVCGVVLYLIGRIRGEGKR